MPASQVVKALEIFLVNQQIRREWVDKGKDTKFERLNKEKDEELKPKKDIVKELTNNSDLSKYEERLLSCIVKPGTPALCVQRSWLNIIIQNY